MATQRPFVLGSASPRRRAILATAGLDFDVKIANVDESLRRGETAHEYVVRVTRAKLDAVLALGRGPAVLCAATIVVLDERGLRQPPDREEAAAMLLRLGGNVHDVITSVALGRNGETLAQQTVTTRVFFRDVTEAEAHRYAATGEGLDKAGAYAVQGVGGGFVLRIEGSYTNVVGLPLAETLALLRAYDVVGSWP